MFGIDSSLAPALLVLIFIVITLCVPFFIWRIRNEAIRTNQLLARILAAVGEEASGPGVKICPKCHTRNRGEDVICIGCGGPI